jgi:iron complex outermembrane receptor protein
MVAPAISQDLGSNPLEEVVVIAEKRAESLQDVALSITAFTENELRAFGVQTTWDLMERTPGMMLSVNGPNAHLYLRGVGSDILGVGNEPSSAIYMDGIYLGRSQNAVATLLDVESVEVLRGPQGTLYGRNAVGGALLIINNRPTDRFEAEGRFQYGNLDKTYFQGSISGPLIRDRVNGRLAILKSDQDGFVDNEFPGAGREQGDDSFGVRGALEASITDDLDLYLSADYIINKESGPVSKVLTPGLANEAGAVFIPDFHTVNLDVDNERELKNYGILGELTWDLGAVLAKAIVGHRDNRWDDRQDSDGTEIAQQILEWEETQDQQSVELQLLSDSDSDFEWVVGTYAFWEDSALDVALIRPIDPFLSLIEVNATNETDAYAAFGQASYWISKQLKATAGLRYSWEEKDHIADLGINGLLLLSTPGKESWDAWTPKFGLNFYWSDATLLYFTATNGFKSGGFNSVGGGESFDPEYLWAYEIGMKTQFLDRRAQLNIGAFYYDYSDLQVTRWTQNLTVVENAAQATIIGSEIELLTNPVQGLELSLGISLLDAEYDEYETFNPAFLDLGLQDLSGNKLRDAPDFTANLMAQYSIPVAEFGALTLRGEYNYQSEVFFSPFNERDVRQSGYELVNVRATLRPNNDRWEVSLWGRNILDEDYLTTAFRFDSTGFNVLGNVGAARTYGIDVGIRF